MAANARSVNTQKSETLLFSPGTLGPTRRSRSGPTAPVPASSGPTPLERGRLATTLAKPFLSLPKTDPGGARTSSQTILVGPGELGTVGPKQVGEIMPQTDGRCGSPARRAVGPGSPPRPAMRPMPGVQPVSSRVPAAPRTGRSRQCDGRRVKPYSQSGSWPCRCLGTSR